MLTVKICESTKTLTDKIHTKKCSLHCTVHVHLTLTRFNICKNV